MWHALRCCCCSTAITRLLKFLVRGKQWTQAGLWGQCLFSVGSLWSSCPPGRAWPANHPSAPLRCRGEHLDFCLLPPFPLPAVGSGERLGAVAVKPIAFQRTQTALPAPICWGSCQGCKFLEQTEEERCCCAYCLRPPHYLLLQRKASFLLSEMSLLQITSSVEWPLL